MTGLALETAVESWPLAGRFVISRGAKVEAAVVVATVHDAKGRGRGECVPYARYGESVEAVRAALAAMAEPLRQGLTREDLQELMPPGAARNALDCALWDHAAKAAGVRAWTLAGLAGCRPLTTAFTIGMESPEAMAAQAAAAAGPGSSQQADEARSRAIPHRSSRFGIGWSCGYAAREWLGSTW